MLRPLHLMLARWLPSQAKEQRKLATLEQSYGFAVEAGDGTRLVELNFAGDELTIRLTERAAEEEATAAASAA